MGVGGPFIRVTPAEGSLSRNACVDRQGLEVFSFSVMCKKAHKDGTQPLDENVNPNSQLIEPLRTMTPFTIGSPTKSGNSAAFSMSRGGNQIVVASHKRKAKKVTVKEAHTASKRT